ncbi:DMT family transporter [Streptococcus oricebi]|uniref:EamA family transporter n=1 Tax=Streptococcus oricebi TaxID=1547447 RepID=A0ABS5B1U5_9STRE|nr:DMT family transporter [Streptococcus oricebi]MBP2622801.1 EamA family transporter [Streptococcus oricebi]
MSKEVKGSLLILAAGLAWGLSGVSGQYLMGHGFSPLILTNIRILFAGFLLVLLAYGGAKEQLLAAWQEPKALFSIFLFGLLGLLLNQLAYLIAVHESNAGTATVLQYVCPVLVLGYSCLKNWVWPSLLEVLAIALAMLGTFLIASHGQIHSLSMTPTGLFWGLFSAVTYALYILLPIKLIQRFGSMTVIGLGMLMAGVLMTPFTGLWSFVWPLDPTILLALLGLVGLGTVFTYTVFLKGASLVGPVKSSLLASIEPIAAVFFAFLIMHDRFYLIDLLGMVLILSAVSLISVRDLLLHKKKGLF